MSGLEDGIVVRCRGLPTKATSQDVQEFLQEWTPRRVLLSLTARRSTGEAYVVFDTREQAEGACSRDKDIFGAKFGERYVRLSVEHDTTPADLLSLEGAPKASKPRRPHIKMDTVVKVGGLPRGITPPEVLQLFWGWQAKLTGAYVQDAPLPAATATTTTSNGGGGGGAAAAQAVSTGGTATATATAGGSAGNGSGSGSGNGSGSGCSDGELRAEAFIDFELAEHATAAVASRHGTTITTAAGAFRLTVQKASRAEWEAITASGAAGGNGFGGGGGGYLRIKGLPAAAAPGDVLAFFQGYRVRPNGVHLPPAPDGRRSLQGLVEFESAPEAARALQERNDRRLGEAFGERRCQLEQLGRPEFEQELQRLRLQAAGNGASSSSVGTGAATIGPASLAPMGLPGVSSMGAGGSVGMPFGPMGVRMGLGMFPPMPPGPAGFMPPGLPPMMLPPGAAGFGMPPGMPPMPGGWPAAAAMPAAAHMQQFIPGPAGGMMPAGGAGPMGAMFPGAPAWPGMAGMGMGLPPNPPTARYMVQDLTTGQKVFLDPRFNLSGYGALPPPTGALSCSAVATAGTTYGATATGPAASQQTQSAAAVEGGSGEGAAAAGEMSEDSNRQGTAGTAVGANATPTVEGLLSGKPTPSPATAPALGNGGSSGNGHSVAPASPDAAAGNGNGTSNGNGAGASVQQPPHGGLPEVATAVTQAGAAGEGQQSVAQKDGAKPDTPAAAGRGPVHVPTKHRHGHHAHHHHHHKHSHHHHHHHHYHDESQRGSAAGNGGSSGDEGRTNGGSGGGSNEGSDGGNGQASNKAPGGDSSGEGSGADDGATRPAAAAAGGWGSSRRAHKLGRQGEQKGPAAEPMEVEGEGAGAAGAPPAALLPAEGSPPADDAAAAAAPDRQQPGPAAPGRVHSQSPEEQSALRTQGTEQPPAKRARNQ